jgi:hypothetical protein
VQLWTRRYTFFEKIKVTNKILYNAITGLKSDDRRDFEGISSPKSSVFLDVTLFSQVGTCSLLHGGRVN